MADYHTVYKNRHPESTEWEDIHRKLGNLPEAEPVFVPPPFSPSRSPTKDVDWLSTQNVDELDELEDDQDLEDDRFLEEYRRKRLEELKASASRPRFGTVVRIEANGFITEVTNAGHDVWVLVHLDKDGFEPCRVLQKCLDELATKYPHVKSVKIKSTDCIPGYPDSNLPTLIVYRNTDVAHNFVGLNSFRGLGTKTEDVEVVLRQLGVLTEPEN